MLKSRTAAAAAAPLLLLVVSPVVVGGAGCFGDRYRPATTTWGGDSSSDAPPPPPPPSTPATAEDANKKLTAKDVAAAAKTADECQAKAKDYYAKDPTRGLALIKACMGREDFIALKDVVSAPWKKDIARKEDLQLALAEVIARRGGFVEADTLLCRKAGIPLFDISSAVDDPEKLKGRLLLARGTVLGVAREKAKDGAIQVASFAESSWADEAVDENTAPPPLDDLNVNTGRTFFARVEPDESRLVQKKHMVVALRVEARRDSGDDPSVIGSIAGLWPAASVLAARDE